MKGLSEDEPAEPHVDENAAVPVVPVQGHQAVFSGFLGRSAFGKRHELFVLCLAVFIRHQVIDEPQEDVSNRRLSGLDPVVARQHRSVDDPAHAGDVGEVAGVFLDHHITGAGTEDLDEHALGDSCADGPHVRIESSRGDRDPGFEAEFRGPFVGQSSREVIGGVGLFVQAIPQVGESGIECFEKLLVRQAVPFLAIHGLVSGGAYAPHHRGRIGVSRQYGGHVVAVFDETVRGPEDLGGHAFAVENLAPEPFRGVGAAALGEVLRPDLLREGGDFRCLGMAGVIFPQPGHRIQIVCEFRQKPQRGAVRMDGQGCASGCIDTDSDDVLRLEIGIGAGSQLEGFYHDVLRGVEVVLRVLARDVRVFRIQQDPGLSARVVVHARCGFIAVTEIDDHGTAGVCPVVQSECIVLHSCFSLCVGALHRRTPLRCVCAVMKDRSRSRVLFDYLEHLVVRAHVFGDLDPDGLSLLRRFHRLVLDLHRGDSRREVRRVSLDVDGVTDGHRAGSDFHRAHPDFVEVVCNSPDFLFAHCAVSVRATAVAVRRSPSCPRG